MLVWLSDGLERAASVSRACLARESAAGVTHDHLFHSILGLLQVESVVREDSLDLFSRCHAPRGMPLLAHEPTGLKIS
jgi:lipid A ethanolaminephosphotransferase